MKLTPICVKCGREMRCLKNQIYVVHFLNDRKEDGIDFVVAGDKYGCGCGNEIITGMSSGVLGMDLDDKENDDVLSTDYVEIKRG